MNLRMPSSYQMMDSEQLEYDGGSFSSQPTWLKAIEIVCAIGVVCAGIYFGVKLFRGRTTANDTPGRPTGYHHQREIREYDSGGELVLDIHETTPEEMMASLSRFK